ncbi:hypothetical protein TRIATDRAFT_86044 [Trichoderma atroviride IMI 206040]|uniref:Uncharacterized protein n=1 Tax=Hypocrea atroviridis (strain ATCC 20476 / IMI 206040) TaxID=452589 RepID=G9P0C9_HYPAI|nr:uncharacterized protein TRIATDRAFT_86044 [Trichoderma atroviride IMI 206040]EHK43120.1 hypothetical protein TRIATDRAFT_86044 [Trichoderma atroviride IMI 206040]
MYPVLFRNTTCLVYDACKFSAKGYAQQPERGNHTFYKMPDRPLTTDAEESITMHTDCFKLCHQAFKSYTRDSSYKGDPKEEFRRLWLAATWRYAWKSMPPLKLPSHSTLIDPSPSLISKLCGFKKEFLPEIAVLIQSYSQSSILWRFDATLQLVEELSLATADDAVTCSLSKVLCWSRNGSPRFVQDELADPFVCLAIDSQGIRSIDRVSELSATLAAQMSIHPNVLLIEPVEAIKSIDMEFKLGRSRLRLPTTASLNVWSAPLPVSNLLNIKNHERDAASASSASLSSHLVATSLDPRYCTGISLFVTATPGSKIVGIYGHSHRESRHPETFEYMTSFHGCRLIWIYIPLATNDKIHGIGVRRSAPLREPHSITLQMTSGQYIVGIPPTKAPVYETLYIAGQQHLTLIHSSPSNSGISVIKADADHQFKYCGIPSDGPPVPAACSSSAPLENISSIHVFTDESTRLCKGLLIEYNDGLKRSLGQCRLGMDSVQSYKKPSSISHASTYQPTCERHLVPCKGVHVIFDSQNHHYGEDEGLIWEHYEMKGQLYFWFTMHEVYLKVSQD